MYHTEESHSSDFVFVLVMQGAEKIVYIKNLFSREQM